MASATAFAVREQPGAAGNNTEDFAALLDATLGADTGFAGSVVTGRVLRIDDDYAVVDVGLKSEGRVPLKEFAPQGQKPEVKPPLTRPKITPLTRWFAWNAFSRLVQASSRRAFSRDSTMEPSRSS